MKLLRLNPYWLTIEHTGGKVLTYRRPAGCFFTSSLQGPLVVRVEQPGPRFHHVALTTKSPRYAWLADRAFTVSSGGSMLYVYSSAFGHDKITYLAPHGTTWSLLPTERAFQFWCFGDYAERPGDFDSFTLDRVAKKQLHPHDPAPGRSGNADVVTVYLERL